MRRREFIALLGGVAAPSPLAARAQQAPMPVIGLLNPNAPEAIENLLTTFRRGLGETGYIEGRNVAIEYRWARGSSERLPELAADLVRRGVTVIATPGSLLSARAAKAATSTIPIVFGIAGDPVQLGLAASLNRPGGNATGFVEINTDIASKRLGLLHDLLPGALRFALLVESTTTGGSVITSLQAEASAMGLQIEGLVSAGSDTAIGEAFASLAQKRIDALLLSPGPLFYALRVQLAALATRYTIPVMYWDRALIEAGGLISYGSSVADMFRQVGIYAGRILKGQKPADLPVMQATKFELVVNLKAARAIGLTIPETFLVRADEVIE
jgi:putative ABC transport system substrate-binding protein